ncbi:MAG: hypothetical protein M1820_000260 [Bogoriella megaspora]|nr:MAG: hypothetical protein M1820_000260 [Bogoriella megaspora]
MPVLQTLLRITSFKSPFLSTLVPSIALSYGIQAGVAVPSILAHSERFYDASGSVTYLFLAIPHLRARAAASAAGLAKPAITLSSFNWRQLALSLAIGIWATRLGTFLFRRINKEGSDSRFDKIRDKALPFAGAFFIQATWVAVCSLPVLALNSIPAPILAKLPALLATDAIGLALYAGGISFEALADYQKSVWMEEKKQKKHDEPFLSAGLWSKSRHPNYFGESCLWSGIAVAAGGILVRNIGQSAIGLSGGWPGRIGAASMAAISPAFVTSLLLFVSGIPLSEKKYDEKYGDRKDYQKWKKEVPMFIPKL